MSHKSMKTEMLKLGPNTAKMADFKQDATTTFVEKTLIQF